ncbi:hypothetical protein SHIRM173S_05847 [Streptomyces hirsutus]
MRQNRRISFSLATLHRVADSCSSTGRCVRNFSSVNGSPPLPMRSCRNTTPGPSLIRSVSAHTSSSGPASSSSVPDTRMSSTRLPALSRRAGERSRRRHGKPASRSFAGYGGESASTSRTTQPRIGQCAQQRALSGAYRGVDSQARPAPEFWMTRPFDLPPVRTHRQALDAVRLSVGDDPTRSTPHPG